MNHSIAIESGAYGMPEEVTEPSRQSDQRLMQRLANNDTSALETLIERFGEPLNVLIGRLTAWGPDRDDILQDVFLLAWQRAGTFRGDGTLGGWLRQLAVNRCRKQHRARQAFLALFEKLTWIYPTSSSDGKVDDSYDPSTLQASLTKLKSADRMAIVLFYLEDLPGHEVAELLNISSENLHVRLHRARQKLRVIIESEAKHV